MPDYEPPAFDEELLFTSPPSSPRSGTPFEETLPLEKWASPTKAGRSRNPYREQIHPRLACLRGNRAWIGHVVLLSVSAIMFVSSVCLRTAEPTDLACSKKLSAWCMLHPVENSVTYETVRFNIPAVPAGPYVGKGDDVDRAWQRITDVPDIVISAEDMARLGMPIENAVVVAADPDTGRRGYRAGVEVFHQLHCLNLLRRNCFAGIREVGPEEENLVRHLDHCLDALRQAVTCQADVGVFPYYSESANGPRPNYSTPHRCRDYDGVRRWAVENGSIRE